MNLDDIVVGIVALGGGELVGRTRLQKTAYLLDRCGMSSGLPFEYHHYGPYSADLVGGSDEARAFGRLRTEEKLGRYGIPYTIFTTDENSPTTLGGLEAARAREILTLLAGASDIVLELAATIVYLREHGYAENVIEEVKIRKPLKATPERLAKAERLIDELGLGDRTAIAAVS